MNRKRVIALIMSVLTVGFIASPAVVSNAEGLTQAASAEGVSYSTISAEDEAILKTMFDADYYKAENPDLVELFGDDTAKLFEHFCKRGLFEGRTCNANFDPAAYASAYGELKDAFGLDIIKYYVHYSVVGSKENRNLTTMKACADAGITVTTLSSTPISITPSAYRISVALGTKDYATINTAIERAANEHKLTVVKNGDKAVVISGSKTPEQLKDYTKIGTIGTNEELKYYVFDNSQGTAIFKTATIDEDSIAVFTTNEKATFTNADKYCEITVKTRPYEAKDAQELEASANEHPQMNTKTGEKFHYKVYAYRYTDEYREIEAEKAYDKLTASDYSEYYEPLESGTVLSIEGGHGSSWNVDGVWAYADGALKEDGTVEKFPVEYPKNGYAAYIRERCDSDGNQASINGMIKVDTLSSENTKYTICAGIDEEGSKRELVIGLYDDTTGMYYYMDTTLPDKKGAEEGSGTFHTNEPSTTTPESSTTEPSTSEGITGGTEGTSGTEGAESSGGVGAEGTGAQGSGAEGGE